MESFRRNSVAPHSAQAEQCFQNTPQALWGAYNDDLQQKRLLPRKLVPLYQYTRKEAFGCVTSFFLGLWPFPVLSLAGLLIKAKITIVAAGRNDSRRYSLLDSAPQLFPVGASYKAALAQIGAKLPKGPGQVLFPQQLHAFGIKGGETRGICHKGILSQPVELYMPGSVPAPAQLLANLSHLKAKAWG